MWITTSPPGRTALNSSLAATAGSSRCSNTLSANAPPSEPSPKGSDGRRPRPACCERSPSPTRSTRPNCACAAPAPRCSHGASSRRQRSAPRAPGGSGARGDVLDVDTCRGEHRYAVDHREAMALPASQVRAAERERSSALGASQQRLVSGRKAPWHGRPDVGCQSSDARRRALHGACHHHFPPGFLAGGLR